MNPNRSALMLGGLLLTAQLCSPTTASAQPGVPLYRLVDTAAQRLATAEPVAAYKWVNGGPITDPQRAGQVLDNVAADARARGINPDYVRAVFTDQIDATEGVQYTRFGQWKFDDASAPITAPDLSASRAQIDDYNRIMVEEIALHWDSLHSPTCAQDLEIATTAVTRDHHLDPLYTEALTAATRAYCETT